MSRPTSPIELTGSASRLDGAVAVTDGFLAECEREITAGATA